MSGPAREDVERAVRYLAWWLPLNAPHAGLVAVDAIRTLTAATGYRPPSGAEEEAP